MKKEELREDRFINEKDLERILDEKLSKLNLVEPDHPKKPERHLHKPHHLEHNPKEHNRLMLNIDEDFETLINIFEDESTVEAVIKTLRESPVEIQIIAKIVIRLYDELDTMYEE